MYLLNAAGMPQSLRFFLPSKQRGKSCHFPFLSRHQASHLVGLEETSSFCLRLWTQPFLSQSPKYLLQVGGGGVVERREDVPSFQIGGSFSLGLDFTK